MHKQVTVFICIIACILLCSCDYYQESVSRCELTDLKTNLNDGFDLISDAYTAANSNNHDREIIREVFGLSISVEYDDTSSASGLRDYESVSEFDALEILKLTNEILRKQMMNLTGYRIVPGTIPRPLNGVSNGYWLSCRIDTSDLDTVLGYEIEDEAYFMALFDEDQVLYEIRISFSYGADGDLCLLFNIDHGWNPAKDGSQASGAFQYGNDEPDLLACDPVG